VALQKHFAVRFFDQFRQYEVVFLISIPGVLRVWLAVELIAAVYIVSFAWFWQLCRSSARRELTHVHEEEAPSNLIPFERGLQMQLHKKLTAI
jgi:hypothetical protein